MRYCLQAIVLLLLVNCSNSKKISKEVLPYEVVTPVSQTEFDKQGHRGCRGLMPENTIPAMIEALSLGVTTLEMDVVVSKDNKIVVSHEPFMGSEIATKPNGEYVTAAEEKSLNIYQMNYEEVEKYDVGMKPHSRFPKQTKIKTYKPLLADLLDSIAKDMMVRRRPFPYFNIETKCMPAGDNLYHPKPEEFVELLMAVIKEKNIEERVIVQSFDFRSLKYLHQKYPSIKTAALLEPTDKRSLDDVIKELGFRPTIYSPEYHLVKESLVNTCHVKDIKLIPWTVNDKATIGKLKAMGVDGIISDYPNLFNE
jgi:glycerophosphoryl diester phosphodiesterase